MGIYCPQNGQTYATLVDFEAMAAANDFGTKTIGEVSGTVTDTTAINMDGPYPNGLEIRAAVGEEFTGVKGAGAKLLVGGPLQSTGSTGTNCAYEIYDLEIGNYGGYVLALISCSQYYPFDVRVERCGLFNDANVHSSRKVGLFSHNLTYHTAPVPQAAIFRDCVMYSRGGIVLEMTVGGPAHGDMIVERVTAFTKDYVSTGHGVITIKEVAGSGAATGGSLFRDIFAFSVSTVNDTDFDTSSVSTLTSLDYFASEDTTANSVTNYLTGIGQSDLENYATGDYRVKATSALVGAGSSGGGIGAFVPVGGGASNQTVALSSIASAELFGSPSVLLNTIILAIQAIASNEAFGSINLGLGSVTVNPLGIATGETTGLISIVTGTQINVSSIASLESFGLPTTQKGSVSVQMVGVSTAESFGLLSAHNGSSIVKMTGIATSEAFGSVRVAPPENILSMTGVSSSFVAGQPMIAVGDVIIRPASLNDGNVFGLPSAQLAQLYIRPEGISSGMMFGRVIVVGGDFRLISDEYAIISPVIDDVIGDVITDITH